MVSIADRTRELVFSTGLAIKVLLGAAIGISSNSIITQGCENRGTSPSRLTEINS